MLLLFVALLNTLSLSQQISLRKVTKRSFLPAYVPASKGRYMTVTLCRGGRKNIGCPNQQLLHIFTAFYGKLSGHDCDDPIRNVRDEIPTCSSKDAGAVVRESCHNQQSCDIYAEDSMYQNPCPEVMKYLFVSYTCQGKSNILTRLRDVEDKMYKSREFSSIDIMPKRRMDEPIHTTTVCDGGVGSITCPNLKLIHIKAAFYGRRSGRDCQGKLTREQIPTCIAPNTMKTIKDTCNKQQSCDLYADSNLYGLSPCLGQTRYLYVAYSCEGHSNLERELGVANLANRKPINGAPFSNSNQAWQHPMRQVQRTEMFRPNPILDSQPYIENKLESSYRPLKKSTVWRRLPMKASLCSHCDGDCNNFFCYGCGGCPEPPIAQQIYKFPYEKEDAVLHDAFAGNEMQLSGLIMWPVPRTFDQLEREREQANLRRQLIQQQLQQQVSRIDPDPFIPELKIQRDSMEHESSGSGDDDEDEDGDNDDDDDDDDDDEEDAESGSAESGDETLDDNPATANSSGAGEKQTFNVQVL